MRTPRKSIRRMREGRKVNIGNERERRGRPAACVERFSPIGQQVLTQDGAQMIAGPGEGVISCPWGCVGLAPAERHPETQLLTLNEAPASKVIKMITVRISRTCFI